MRRWSLLGLSLPLTLAPRIDACEYVEDGRFRFHVEISHPLAGLRRFGLSSVDSGAAHSVAGSLPSTGLVQSNFGSRLGMKFEWK